MSQETSCRICGSSEHRTACVKDGYRYVACAFCGVTRQFPYPTREEMTAFYDRYLEVKNHENPLYMSDASWGEFRRIKDLNFLEMGMAPSTLAGKRVLDVGCATGLFVQYAHEYGAHATGIDVSSGLTEIARKKGLDCSCRSLFDIREEFDLVNMSHVIEHVDEPVKYLRHIHSILKPQGYLVVETPCTGLVSETFAEAWRFYMPVEHINLFSQESLFRTANTCGFSINGWIRFGSGNTTGSVPAVNKKVSDTVAKKLGIGDTISVLFGRM